MAGVPVIVTTLDDHPTVRPDGNPLKVAPVAPVVEYVILLIAVLTQTVWLLVPTPEVRLIVLVGLTVM